MQIICNHSRFKPMASLSNGAKFEVLFDHESIKSSQKDLRSQKAGWVEILQDFDCQLRYCKCPYNVVADALSCMPKVDDLSFTKLRSDLLASFCKKCEHE